MTDQFTEGLYYVANLAWVTGKEEEALEILQEMTATIWMQSHILSEG